MYCPAGTYCATLGCCLNGSTLAECNEELSLGNTTLAPSVPGTLFATMPTLLATTPLVATTSRVTTSSLITSSNRAVPTLSPLSVTSTLSVANPSVSTSPAGQTSGNNDSAGLASDIPPNLQTKTAALPRTTSSAINSGSKNSKCFMGLVSGGLGFLLML